MDLTIPGVRIGHWTDEAARTGCTVILLPDGTVASGEVRGGAPATREFALLSPERSVQTVDAVVLTGGSAFGLASADGVVQHLVSEERGVTTSAGRVPIVVAMAVFDLDVGSPDVRPGPREGLAAARSAAGGPVALGAVGAGTGATVGKWRGPGAAVPGGVGGAIVRVDELEVAALVVVNAVGEVEPVGVEPADIALLREFGSLPAPPTGEATTICAVVTNARLDKLACLHVAQGAHDGFARALFPPHTRADGDAAVACATGLVEVSAEMVRAAAVVATERAIRSIRSGYGSG